MTDFTSHDFVETRRNGWIGVTGLVVAVLATALACIAATLARP